MSYASTVLADGAVGYWRLGEASNSLAAADAVGNSNGTYATFNSTSKPTVGQTGISGGGGDTAALFTAANESYVVIPDVAAQHVGDVFTIEWWMKASTPASTMGVFGGGTGKPAIDFSSSGAIQLVRSQQVLVVTSTSTLPNDSAFHHCVATKNAATVKLYLDGADVTGSVTNATMPNTTGWNIGNDNGSAWLTATLDEVAIYPTALSLATVQNHFSLGAPVVTGSITPTDNTLLLFH